MLMSSFLMELGCEPRLGSLDRIANESATWPMLLSDLQDQCCLPEVQSTLQTSYNQRKKLSPSPQYLLQTVSELQTEAMEHFAGTETSDEVKLLHLRSQALNDFRQLLNVFSLKENLLPALKSGD